MPQQGGRKRCRGRAWQEMPQQGVARDAAAGRGKPRPYYEGALDEN